MGIRTDMMGSGYVTENYYKDYTRRRGNTDTPAKDTDGSKELAGKEEPKSCREQILEKMEEMAQNIKRGTIQPKFKIGAQEYTIKEWEKLLEKFDAAEEAILEEAKAHAEEVKEQAEETEVKDGVLDYMRETES